MGPQEEGEPARPDADRFQRPEGELAAWVEHGLFDRLIRPPQDRLRDRETERLGGLEVDA